MKNYTLISIFALTGLLSMPTFCAETNCKNLKACAEWATYRTAVKYDLGNLDRRSMKVEKDFTLDEGDADFNFSFVLLQNNMARIKSENGGFQVIQLRELKNYHFPLVKEEEIPSTLDFYSVEFPFSNKGKVKNAMQILKKYISKEGRLLEVADATKILVTDTGVQLQALRAMAKEINK